jgi:phage-related holin
MHMEGFWSQVVAFFLMLWGSVQVKFMLGHILVNVVVAIAASVVIKEFLWSKIGAFLYQKILPFLAVYVVAVGVGDAAGMGWLATVVWGILELNLAADLADNLSKMGIPMPESLMKPDGVIVIDASELAPPETRIVEVPLG